MLECTAAELRRGPDTHLRTPCPAPELPSPSSHLQGHVAAHGVPARPWAQGVLREHTLICASPTTPASHTVVSVR